MKLVPEAYASELRLSCRASSDRPKAMRHAIASFLNALSIEEETRDDILTAVGEALANAVEHAYRPDAVGRVEVVARFDESERLVIDVIDDGTFIEREPRPERGLGLRIIGAIALTVAIDQTGGTRISMQFDAG